MKLILVTGILFLINCLAPLSNKAQENEYSVMTKSGDVFLIDRVSKNHKEIHLGDKLNPSDRIQLNYNGYLVLVDTNLQTVELIKEGIYNISGIDSLFTMKHNSITANITKFILNEMSTNEEKYNDMKTLGAVVRNSINIEAAVPKFGKIVDTLYNFSWHPLQTDSHYIFRVFNQEGNTLYMDETNDTSITLNLAKFNLQFDQKYFWSVLDKNSLDNRADSISFTLINSKQKEIIFNQIENLKKDFLVENSPLNYFLIAKILEREQLNEAALKYFKRSIEIFPESEFYWVEYIHFLLNIGLTREALVEWNKSPFGK